VKQVLAERLADARRRCEDAPFSGIENSNVLLKKSRQKNAGFPFK
jgi:hypothetical protein